MRPHHTLTHSIRRGAGIIFPSMSRTNPMNTHSPFSLLFTNNALFVSLSNADDGNSSRANSATASSAS